MCPDTTQQRAGGDPGRGERVYAQSGVVDADATTTRTRSEWSGAPTVQTLGWIVAGWRKMSASLYPSMKSSAASVNNTGEPRFSARLNGNGCG